MAFLHRSERFNLTEEECKWPVNILGKEILECSFPIEDKIDYEYKGNKISVVTLPAKTKIYHATMIYPRGKSWFKTQYPMDAQKGLVWFASTDKHLGNINSTHHLEYTIKQPLRLVFEHNISKKYGKYIRGYEYIPYLYRITKFLEENKELIDGYLGCNECEIGIYNNSIKTKLNMIPKVVLEKDLKYID